MTWLIYKKELKESLSDRKIIFLSLIIPIFLNFAFVLFYEYIFLSPKAPEQIVVAINDVDSEVYTSLSKIENIQWLKVQDPKASSLEGESLLGVVINDPATITIVADQTSQKASHVVEQIKEQLSKYREQIVDQRLTGLGVDRNLVHPFEVVEESLRSNDDISFMMILILLPLLVTLYVCMGGLPVAIDLFSGEKEHKTMEAVLLTPVSRTKLALAKWLTVSTVGTLAGIISVLSFTIVTKLFTERMAASLNYGSRTFIILLFALIVISLLSMLSAIVVSVISLLARTYKEAQAYTAPITALVMVPYFVMVTMSPNEIPDYFYWTPFLNTFALIKELIYGITSISHLLISIFSSSIFIAVLFVILDRMIKNERWVLGK